MITGWNPMVSTRSLEANRDMNDHIAHDVIDHAGRFVYGIRRSPSCHAWMTAQILGHDEDDFKKVSCDQAQMSLNHRIARYHLESLIEELTGVDKAVPDRDGDYLINTQSSGFFARVEGNEPATFRPFFVIVADIQASAELHETVKEINTRLNFLGAMYVGEQVLIEWDLLAMTASPQDFREVCSRIDHASGPLWNRDPDAS